MILTVRALTVVYPCKLVFPDGTGFDYPNGFQFMVLTNPDGKEFLLPSGLELELDDEVPLPVTDSRMWVSPLAYQPKLIPTKGQVPHADKRGNPKDVPPPHADGGRVGGEMAKGTHSTKKPKKR